MKAAILQCDQVLEELNDQFDQYDDMIRRMFNNIGKDIEFITFNCEMGEYPQHINEFDFFITTGSRRSCYEDEAWILQLIEFIQALDKNHKKLIGICFGHQLMALALDGAVERSSRGWGVGIANNRIIHHPEWMKQKTNEINVLVSHRDQVTRLPHNAQVIAESDFCPYFLIQYSPHFLSIQGHPEWYSHYSKALMNERRNIIPADCIEQGLCSLEGQPDNDLIAEWMHDFIHH